MLKYLIPHIELRHVSPMMKLSVIGALIAGIYGIAHDQVTYTISPEYFSKFKFDQFAYANLGSSDRFFAGTIGFLATWWVGFFCTWFLARRLWPVQDPVSAKRQIIRGIKIVFGTAILAAFIGYAYGLWVGPNADYSRWQPMMHRLKITNTFAFIRVGYIHNASYIGGAIGFIATFVLIPTPIKNSNGMHAKNNAPLKKPEESAL